MDRLFEKFQQISPRARHIRIRLIEPSIDIDSLIKNLSEKLVHLREQDPVLLHIDTAGVSMKALIAAQRLFCCWLYCFLNFLFLFYYFLPFPGSLRSGGAPLPSVSSGLSERQSWHALEKECSTFDHC